MSTTDAGLVAQSAPAPGDVGAGHVLVLAPSGGDASAIEQVLRDATLEALICRGMGDLVKGMEEGATAAVITEEALGRKDRAELTEALRTQPEWSDFPILVLASSERESEDAWVAVRGIEGTANLTLLERPLGTATFLSAVRLAVESRKRQYRVRDELAARREAEMALRESEERLRFAQQAGGVAVFDWDMRSATTMWTGGVEELFGLPSGPFSGRYDDWSRRVHPEDLQRLERLFSDWIRSDRTEESWEYRYRHPDGQEHWLLARGRLVRDEQGEPLRMIGTNIDVTRQKNVEWDLRRLARELEARVRERTALLAESEAKYRGLVENTLDIPFHLAADGTVRYVGPQVTRFGFVPEEVQGRPFRQIVFQADRQRAVAAFQEMVEEGEARPLEFRIRASDGRRFWVEGQGVLHKNTSGEVEGLTGVLRDITDRKRAEGVQATQQRRLRELAGRLASAQDEEQRRIAQGLHDDVAQLLAACSVKMAVAEGAEETRREQIRREIDDLLGEASDKIHSLSFELVSSTLSRLGLREAVEELCETLIERYGLVVHVEGDGKLGELDDATATILFKAVRELLFNVVKHAGTDEARVSIVRRSGTLELSVEDHGRGFPPMPEPGRSSLGKGMGLFGISERMRELGGELDIMSEPGVGTRVALRVPATSGEQLNLGNPVEPGEP